MGSRASVFRISGFLILAFAVLAPAGAAEACVCEQAPLEERLDRADAAVVGRIVGEDEGSVGGLRQRLFTFEVEQRVKGDLPQELVIRSPSGSDCDLPESAARPRRESSIGLLLTRSPDGAWLANACSVVAAGPLVAAGGEPRGGVIKVVIGLALLGIVLSWALRRRRLGVRPQLPGPPEP